MDFANNPISMYVRNYILLGNLLFCLIRFRSNKFALQYINICIVGAGIDGHRFLCKISLITSDQDFLDIK
ncbi:hypothetical protein QE152_g25164 [Popillia japonica]|uniref:Uncharacterized protein n=1 Tax=Popillia japonica TaxID=7064 RepID=A0AAW1K3J6_POPJA